MHIAVNLSMLRWVILLPITRPDSSYLSSQSCFCLEMLPSVVIDEEFLWIICRKAEVILVGEGFANTDHTGLHRSYQ